MKKQKHFMGIKNAKALDALWEAMEVNEDEFNHANNFYKLSEDTEIKQVMTQNFLRMQTVKMQQSS